MTSAKLRFTAQSTHSSKPQQIIAKGGLNEADCVGGAASKLSLM